MITIKYLVFFMLKLLKNLKNGNEHVLI